MHNHDVHGGIKIFRWSVLDNSERYPKERFGALMLFEPFEEQLIVKKNR